MTRTALSILAFFALSFFGTFVSSATAQDASADTVPEASTATEDPAATEAALDAGETAATDDGPAVESAAAAEAAAQAEAPIESPVPAPAYPVPEPAPSANEGIVYAPPAGANHYPSPQQSLAAPRRHWPRPGQFGFMVAYAPSIPIGSSSDFASNFGFRGFALGLRYMVNEVMSVGIESGWSFQDDKRRETTSIEGERRTLTVTTGQIRSTEIIPLVATAHYYYDAGSIIPHAGLRLGAYYTRRDLDAGLWYFSNDGWHFGFSPEVGVIIPTGSIQVLTAVGFNYLFEAGDMPEEMFFDLRIGILGF